jgi:hypothetical protein
MCLAEGDCSGAIRVSCQCLQGRGVGSGKQLCDRCLNC